MLKKLKIKNYTLIEDLEIEFLDGFQVLTGETGAGKSIIVGAIALLCGQRGNADVLRSGSSKAILEAEFVLKNKKVTSILNENSIDHFEELLIIRREINQKGLSRAFVNDSPVSLNLLSNLTSLLLDLHGQHQHQKLLHVENHCEYLDSFASLNENVKEFKNVHKSYVQIQDELNHLIDKKKKSVNQNDLFSFQIAELDKANLDEEEFELLKKDKNLLENSEHLFEVANIVGDNLYSSENSVLITVSQALNKLKEVEKIDEKYKELADNLASAQLIIEDVGRSSELLKERIEFNPERLEELRKREDHIAWLFKKYQVENITELINYKKKIQLELNHIQNYDDYIEELEDKLQNKKTELSKIAFDISSKRKEKSSLLNKRMNEILISLGMKSSQFETRISWIENSNDIIMIENKTYKCFERGMDEVEFLISMNEGEPLKPLQKIASGGEISRIMLAIKSILSDKDDTNTLVFDEIDNGISGKIAQIVGKKFVEISKNKQLIVITHLPQIASQANSQFAVEKSETNGRTFINLKLLNPNERITEIAKLLGGEKISEEALANAHKLLDMSLPD